MLINLMFTCSKKLMTTIITVIKEILSTFISNMGAYDYVTRTLSLSEASSKSMNVALGQGADEIYELSRKTGEGKLWSFARGGYTTCASVLAGRRYQTKSEKESN